MNESVLDDGYHDDGIDMVRTVTVAMEPNENRMFRKLLR